MTATTLSIDDTRQQLHDIIRKDAPFDDKACDVLELAMQCLGADNGHLTRIDQETNNWEAIITTDKRILVHKANMFPASNSNTGND